jgi:hypothetical protein
MAGSLVERKVGMLKITVKPKRGKAIVREFRSVEAAILFLNSDAVLNINRRPSTRGAVQPKQSGHYRDASYDEYEGTTFNPKKYSHPL